jgi:hypothetical protein
MIWLDGMNEWDKIELGFIGPDTKKAPNIHEDSRKHYWIIHHGKDSQPNSVARWWLYLFSIKRHDI